MSGGVRSSRSNHASPGGPGGDPTPAAASHKGGARVRVAARRWLPRLLGLGLLVWAVRTVGAGNLAGALAKADPKLVLPAALVAFPFIYVKGWRWSRILAGLGVELSVRDAFGLYAIGIWAGQVTPGQAGDFLKAWYLRARGVEIARAVVSSLLDRLFDLAAVFALGAIGLVAYAGGSGGIAIALLGLLSVTVALAAAMTSGWRRLGGELFDRLAPAAWRGRLAGNRTVQALAAVRLDARHLMAVLALTALSWVISLARVYLCFLAVGIKLPTLDYLVAAAVVTLAGLITLGGVGTRDAAMLALLGPTSDYQYAGSTVVAASVLVLVLNFSNIVPGLLLWLREPIPLRSAEQAIDGAAAGEAIAGA